MRDFDVERDERAASDRQCQIGGSVLTRRAGVEPETIFAFQQATANVDEGDATLRQMDDIICTFLEPESAERYLEMRKPGALGDNPLTLGDLVRVSEWMVEEETGRPTSQPSPSLPGQPTTGTASTGNLPSEASTPPLSLSAVS